MAQISDKHSNTQTVTYSDLRGGLNTGNASELIAENELAKAINVEVESVSGALKTVSGTDDLLVSEDIHFKAMMYDSIGDAILLVDENNKVYRTSREGRDTSQVGTIDGQESIEYTAWEDGIVICSGGKLQYYHRGTLETITDSGAPTACHAPFVKDGRIYVAIGDELHCSAVGDEHGWVSDSNDASSSQWLQVGYKDGGKINGVCSLASDIVVLKDNDRAYHIAGSFPEWSVSEIGRQVECKGFHSCVSLAQQALVLGTSSLQTIRSTDEYGDMKSANISQKVQKEIAALGNTKVRYIPSLNQVWLVTGAHRFLFVDMNTGGFFMRQYNSPVIDAIEINNSVYVLKRNKLCRLNPRHMSDDGEYLNWAIQAKTLTTPNSFLVKRMWVDTTPYFENYVEEIFEVDKCWLYGAVPWECMSVYNDRTKIFKSDRDICIHRHSPVFNLSDEAYRNPQDCWENDTYLKSTGMYRSQCRNIDRAKALKVRARGSGDPVLINSISFMVAEV